MKITSTYEERRHTNEYVYETATTRKLGNRNQGKPIERFSVYHEKRHIKLAGHILRQADDEPERAQTFETNSATPIKNPIRRPGRPRTHWATDALQKAWQRHCDELNPNGEEL